ncbi:MAG: hypothetical protein WBL87_02680 [Methanothrix sp.]
MACGLAFSNSDLKSALRDLEDKVLWTLGGSPVILLHYGHCHLFAPPTGQAYV